MSGPATGRPGKPPAPLPSAEAERLSWDEFTLDLLRSGHDGQGRAEAAGEALFHLVRAGEAEREADRREMDAAAASLPPPEVVRAECVLAARIAAAHDLLASLERRPRSAVMACVVRCRLADAEAALASGNAARMEGAALSLARTFP